MHIIYNKYIPFGSFVAINLCGLVFAKSKYGKLTERVRNHERIHSLQQREMLVIPFFVLYCIEWLVWLAVYRNWKKAYRNISFEREAYAKERDLNYCSKRKPFAWLGAV